MYQPRWNELPRADEVLVYLRKSRTDDPSLSVEEVLQKHEAMLDEWAERSLGEAVSPDRKFYEVVSGETIRERPEFQRVLKLIESPMYKAILCYDVQRLSRGDLEDAGRLIKLLRYTNTLVITPQKIYDLQDEYDRDMFERELKRGNEFLEYTKKIMKNGRALSVSQGNYIGSLPPYGYDKATVMDGRRKCPTLTENKEQADVVRMIFELYVKKDMGCQNICNYLDGLKIKPPKGDHWSPAAVKGMLENVHYIGKVKWNWRRTVTVVEDSEIFKTRPKSKSGDYLIYEGRHEAIISEDLFMAAQEKRGRNHRAKPNTKVRNPLAGLLYCQCGRAMSLRTYKKDGMERSLPRLICDGQTHCKTASCRFDEMYEMVCTILEQTIQDFEVKIKNESKGTDQLQQKTVRRLEMRLHELEAIELAQWEAQTNPDPTQRMPADIFKKLNEKTMKEKEEIREAWIKAKSELPAVQLKKDREAVQEFRNALLALRSEDASAEQKNSLLKACIERITYSRGRAEDGAKQIKIHGQTTNTPPTPYERTQIHTPIILDVKLRI